MASSAPMLRSYSTESQQKRDWKRLSLRGAHRTKEVSYVLKNFPL